ncbi:MAG: phage terminase small subunit-related protein [Cyanobacteria bacterium P01_A01_bin.123]
MANSKREQAKALYMQGISISDIAQQIGMSRKQVGRWKAADHWETLRNSLPKPEPIKVVSFDRPRQPKAAPRAPQRTIEPGEYDTLDSLLKLVDSAIDECRGEISTHVFPGSFAAGVNGLTKLIELRLKLKPIDDEALLALVLERYRNPRELAKGLREMGWGQGA